VAEVLVTASEALVLADRIDATRTANEEVPGQLSVVELPWAESAARDEAVNDMLGSGSRVASDRPMSDESPLPEGIVAARLRLLPREVDRFRGLGRDAARALSTTLKSVRPEMTEVQVAAIAARELIDRSMWPVVVLVGGARRLPMYRHPTSRADELIGPRGMVVVCARRHGLIANLTRFVYFEQPTAEERAATAAVADVEAAALDASTAGTTLSHVYSVIADAYARAGYAGAEADHHQGGLAGYRTRESIASPTNATLIVEGSALAWNPSLPGAKIEDTMVVGADGVEIMTADAEWPTVDVGGRARPDVLVRS
jgi:Xaa-Pro aminopeptidase